MKEDVVIWLKPEQYDEQLVKRAKLSYSRYNLLADAISTSVARPLYEDWRYSNTLIWVIPGSSAFTRFIACINRTNEDWFIFNN